ncbi:MAG TPA: lipid A deacylase LpxR family protein [Lysobacter sp.]
MPAAPARADRAPVSCEAARFPPVVNLRFDNDLLGAKDQDQGYTNGVGLTLVSPNLVSYTDDPCLPRLARWLNRAFEALHPDEYAQQNMVVTVAQGLFTPVDRARTELIADDRPYAAVLLVSLGYNARDAARLRTTQLRLGMVGPSAQGEQVQDQWHELIGVEKFQGWDQQLRDEPVLQLVHERMRRWPAAGSVNAGGWGWDAIAHWGGALGNLATYANAGAELRFGWRLPDDFGSSPLRPAGENTAPRAGVPAARRWAAHVFVTVDARGVLHDVTLDGNTFKASHHVRREPWVADAGYGAAVTRAGWKFAFARYFRTREFAGQRHDPVFGSFTVSREF